MTADLYARDKTIARLRTRVTNLEQDAAQANAAIDRYEQEIERMKLLVAASSTDGHTVRRTAQKLAALERVQALATEWGEPGHCGWLSASVLVGQLRTALDQVQQPTTETAPAEHCGHQPLLLSGREVGTECVLRPGHQGSHADQHGMRWWTTTEQQPAT